MSPLAEGHVWRNYQPHQLTYSENARYQTSTLPDSSDHLPINFSGLFGDLVIMKNYCSLLHSILNSSPKIDVESKTVNPEIIQEEVQKNRETG